MQRIIRKFSVAAALLLGMTVGVASRASAQTTKYSVFGGYSYGTSEVSLPELGPFNFTVPTAMHGYGAAFTVNLNNHIGLEASFTGHNGTPTIQYQPATTSNGYRDVDNQGVYTYTFGPRLFQNVGDFSLFTHFLVGGTHVSQTLKETCFPGTSDTCGTPNPSILFTQDGSGFAFKTGGGVDWNHARWGIRILEVDYIHSQMLGSFGGQIPGGNMSFSTSMNNFELTTGITFNFGSSL
jgi:hypothetical protein